MFMSIITGAEGLDEGGVGGSAPVKGVAAEGVRPFIFYKMFYGRAYPNFWQNEIKIKVIDFSFIFIFPSPCHKQHAHEIKSSTILSKLNLQNTFFH